MQHSAEQIHQILATVTDPEIPVLSIAEMGILRGVSLQDETVEVTITPTYSGCPAIDTITSDIGHVLHKHGVTDHRVNLVLSPAWTTDWMSDEAKEKLNAYGIAPPCHSEKLADQNSPATTLTFTPKCPQCGALDTSQISEFGSTACKALWKCNACREPFDYFKPI